MKRILLALSIVILVVVSVAIYLNSTIAPRPSYSQDLGGMEAKFLKYKEVYNNGNSGSAKTINWANGNVQKLTVSAECTITESNPLNGLHVLIIYQGGTAYDLHWPATVKWAEGEEPGYDNNSILIIEQYWDGTYYFTKFSNYEI